MRTESAQAVRRFMCECDAKGRAWPESDGSRFGAKPTSHARRVELAETRTIAAAGGGVDCSGSRLGRNVTREPSSERLSALDRAIAPITRVEVIELLPVLHRTSSPVAGAVVGTTAPAAVRQLVDRPDVTGTVGVDHHEAASTGPERDLRAVRGPHGGAPATYVVGVRRDQGWGRAVEGHGPDP